MKAIITNRLEKPNKEGSRITKVQIIAPKSNISEKVNNYIDNRLRTKYLIRVLTFYVEIYDKNGKLKDSWEYKPTYR